MHMSTLLAALLTAVVVWVFLVRQLTSKPWVVATQFDHVDDIHPLKQPAVRIGLWLFLGMISSLFALFITAYLMRMDPHHGSDWYSVPAPKILWLNTALLILSSIAMQWARSGEQQTNTARTKYGLIAGGLLTFAFLAGQLLGWQQLKSSTHFDLVNPAVGFFYLLTAVHGLHLLGGLYVWAKTTYKVWRNKRPAKDSLSIELCTTYWHYLLLVWFILFGLLLSS